MTPAERRFGAVLRRELLQQPVRRHRLRQPAPARLPVAPTARPPTPWVGSGSRVKGPAGPKRLHRLRRHDQACLPRMVALADRRHVPELRQLRAVPANLVDLTSSASPRRRPPTLDQRPLHVPGRAYVTSSLEATGRVSWAAVNRHRTTPSDPSLADCQLSLRPRRRAGAGGAADRTPPSHFSGYAKRLLSRSSGTRPLHSRGSRVVGTKGRRDRAKGSASGLRAGCPGQARQPTRPGTRRQHGLGPRLGRRRTGTDPAGY